MRERARASLLFAAGAVALAAACSSATESQDGSEADGPREAATTKQRLLALTAPDAELTRAIHTSRVVADADGARVGGERLDRIAARFPARADEPVELREGPRNSPLARVRTLGTTGAALSVDDGVVRYPRALAGSDVLWTTRGEAIEQLVLIEQPQDRFELEWELCLRAGLTSQRRGGGIHFVDQQQQSRLFVPQPFALDAAGSRRDLSLQLTPQDGGCQRLRFSLSLAGMSAPVLVDPALEAVTWIERAFNASDPKPEGRFWYGLAYDPVREVTVLFGGRGTLGSEPFFGDTWEWDGKLWQQVTPLTAAPAARIGFGMTYSAVHGGVVLFGGAVKDTNNVAVSVGETWQWDGKDWTQLPAGGQDPPKLYGASLAYDDKRNVVVLYGGWNESIDNTEVYELGASGWKKPPNQAISPGYLSFFPMTYHAQSSVTFISGGLRNQLFQDFTDETWTWDGQVWSKLAVAGPSPRYDVAAAYDDLRQRTVLWGGETDVLVLDETWEFSGGVYEKRQPINHPYPTSGGRMAYDEKRDRMVMFGGWWSVAQSDTWEYLHFGSKCSVTPDCDGAPCVDGVCCSASTCGTCQACSPTTGKCEPVTGMDDSDTCSGANTCDAAAACKKKNGQACGSPGECASGFCADGVCCNAACQGACEACGLSDSLGTCSFVIGSAVHGSCPGSGPCAASCDGTSAECQFAPSGTDCGTVCEKAELAAKTCDGKGSCVSLSPAACDDHLACANASSCRDGCSENAHCAPGFACIAGACKDAVATCLDEITAQQPGADPMSCVPYRCESGSCRTDCTSAADCAPGNLCTQGGFCAPRPSSPSADDGGCGCRAVGSGPGGSLGWLSLLGLLIWGRRRR